MNGKYIKNIPTNVCTFVHYIVTGMVQYQYDCCSTQTHFCWLQRILNLENGESNGMICNKGSECQNSENTFNVDVFHLFEDDVNSGISCNSAYMIAPFEETFLKETQLITIFYGANDNNCNCADGNYNDADPANCTDLCSEIFLFC